ncbi:MAG: beta-N-acetylhexosaminidase [Saprospiraceae bacterium]|nr:beta-N-acetylhexosaminidase [Saprospiraceae bacterium]
MKQNIILSFLCITGAFTTIFLSSCETGETSTNQAMVIPYPAELTLSKDSLSLSSVSLSLAPQFEDLKPLFEEIFEGLPTDLPGSAPIQVTRDTALAAEAYHLLVTSKGIEIRSAHQRGAIYALQTLRQLRETQNSRDKIPCLTIKDQPRFSYRGMHLDVGRHFFPVSFVKQYIDLLSMYRFNTFHWHLTEDQGWRIEIKKYPKLQSTAAYRKETVIGHNNTTPRQFDGKPYGGYYTQEEIKEVVKYAMARGITIIPEIELPGHAQAAIAAYPELGCTGKAAEVATYWGVFDEVYCPSEKTFTFLQDVLDEVMALFPSPYIHIGGDECPKTRWKESKFCQDLIKKVNLKDEHELQSYFIQRIEKYLNSKGRYIIGWDEILEGGLAPNATVMSWRGVEGGIAAARQKHDVIMTPTDYCYFDYYQSRHANEPLAIGGFLPLSKVYGYEPVPEGLEEEAHRYILGTQGNVWTEYMDTPEKVLYMVLPRMQALAEVAWSDPKVKNYDHFLQRLNTHFEWWKRMGLPFADKTADLNISIHSGSGNGVLVAVKTNGSTLPIQCVLGGKTFTYDKPIVIQKSDTLLASVQRGGMSAGKRDTLVFRMHQAAGKKINLGHMPAKKYSADGPGSLINGVSGANTNYTEEWIGFEGKNLEAEIDLGAITYVDEVSMRFYHSPEQWIYLPGQVSLYFSQDGKNYNEMPAFTVRPTQSKVLDFLIPTAKTKTRYIRLVANNAGLIPAGQPGEGNPAWLFVDEIFVN